MVIPWLGFPLGDLVEARRADLAAKYVAFTTLLDPEQMPGQRRAVLDWPYVEGLRIDEAMHPLALLAVGLYGKVLPNQNGAPLRLVVPWKYGFKGIKSIVKIRFDRAAAADHLEPRGAGRVRLLRQREPGGRSPALEPGHRAAHRRVPAAPDAAVQRLRRAGRAPLRRHGPAQVLLMAAVMRRDAPRAADRIRGSSPACSSGALVPVAGDRSSRGVRGELGANPIAEALEPARPAGARLLLASLACTPREDALRLDVAAPHPAHARAARVLLRGPALRDLRRRSIRSSTGPRSGRTSSKRKFIFVGFARVRAPGPAGAHLDQRRGATPRLRALEAAAPARLRRRRRSAWSTSSGG